MPARWSRGSRSPGSVVAGARDRDLARGPARLCRALALSRDHDGADLRTGALRLVPGAAAGEGTVETGPRVGLRHAAELPWRYWLAGEPSVSAYRPAAPRRRRPTPDL